MLASLVLVLSNALADDDDAQNVKAFNTAYLAYKADAEAGDYESAADNAAKALAEGLPLFGNRTEEVRMLTFNLGLMLSLSGDEKAGFDRLEDAVALTERLHGKNAEQMVPIYEQLERIAGNLGRSRDQRAYAKREVALTTRYFGRRSPELADAALRAGLAYESANPKEAAKYFERAYSAASTEADPDGRIRRRSAAALGSMAYETDDLKEAEAWLLRAIDELSPDRPEMDDVEFRTRRQLVGLFERTGRGDLATEHCVAVGVYRPAKEAGSMQLLYTGEGPMYPENAILRNRTGTVVTRFNIDADGRVHDPELVSGGREFGDFMLDRVMEFRFAPQVLDDQPVVTEGFEFTTNFDID